MNVANAKDLCMYTKPNQKNKPRPGLVAYSKSNETQNKETCNTKGRKIETEEGTWNARRLYRRDTLVKVKRQHETKCEDIPRDTHIGDVIVSKVRIG